MSDVGYQESSEELSVENPAKCIGHLFRLQEDSKPLIDTTNVLMSAKTGNSKQSSSTIEMMKRSTHQCLGMDSPCRPGFAKELKTYLFTKNPVTND